MASESLAWNCLFEINFGRVEMALLRAIPHSPASRSLQNSRELGSIFHYIPLAEPACNIVLRTSITWYGKDLDRPIKFDQLT